MFSYISFLKLVKVSAGSPKLDSHENLRNGTVHPPSFVVCDAPEKYKSRTIMEKGQHEAELKREIRHFELYRYWKLSKCL